MAQSSAMTHSARCAGRGPLTFKAVPPRSGRRVALDRDLDGDR
jgi:hypothetical protein